jgi:hypothetical protein
MFPGNLQIMTASGYFMVCPHKHKFHSSTSVFVMLFQSIGCFIELIIDPFLFHELVVIAFLHNAVIRQHQDPVGIADTGKSVGDSQRSTPLRQFSQRFCHGELTLIVQCGSGLIQNDDGRIFQKYSGNTDPLFLRRTALHPVLPHKYHNRPSVP